MIARGAESLPSSNVSANAGVIERRWLLAIAFIGVMAFATILRLLIVNRYLPYVDYGDEANFWMLALAWRGNAMAEPYGAQLVADWLGKYPPLFIWFNQVVQEVMDAAAGGAWLAPGQYIIVLRLFAAAAGVITTGLVASIGWQLAGAGVGLFAGLVWGFTPLIAESSNFAIADGYVYLACAIAISAAIRAWKRDAPIWLAVSLFGGIAAVYLKYTPFLYALIPFGLVTLAMLRRSPRKMLGWVIVYAVIAAVGAGSLLFGYGALGLSNQEADWTREEGLARMFNLNRVLNNLSIALQAISPIAFLTSLVAGGAAYLYSRARGWRLIPIVWVGLLLIFALLCVMMSAQISNLTYSAGKIRFVLPAVMALIVIWGLALAQIYWTLSLIAQNSTNNLRRSAALPIVVVAVLMLTWAVPAAADGIERVDALNEMSVRELLWRWSDSSLPPDGMILSHPQAEQFDAWNRPWSGYDGTTAFEWWHETQPFAATPEQYVERGISYFVLSASDRELLNDYAQNADALENFLSQLTLLKTIHGGDDLFGSTVSLYRMMPPQHSSDVVYGEQIALEGYDLNTAQAVPGGAIYFRPYWRALTTPGVNYSMFVHLYPAEGDTLMAQFDGSPASPNRLPLTWTDPEELLIGTVAGVPLPDTLAAGDFRLIIGLYDYATGVRLILTGDTQSAGADAFMIPVRVNRR